MLNYYALFFVVFELSEPDSCIIDSWAQGYVQTIFDQSLFDTKETNSFLNNELITDQNIKSERSFLNTNANKKKSSSISDNASVSSRTLKADLDGVKKQATVKPIVEPSPKLVNFSIKTSASCYDSQPKSKSNKKLHRSVTDISKILKENENEELEPNESVEISELKAGKIRMNKANKTEMAEFKALEEYISKAPLACQSMLRVIDHIFRVN